MRKPASRYFAFALLSLVFVFYTVRLNPGGLGLADWVAAISSGIMAVASLVVGILRARRSVQSNIDDSHPS